MPLDSHGRKIDYLRISLTDRCNLRCVYCMPLSGLSFLPGSEVLSASEIERVVGAAASVGFRKIRLTGGEPTLRADIIDIVSRIRSVPGIEDVVMTTNAILLPDLARPLAAAGLHRVNIHVDTLDPQRIRQVMRFATAEQVWEGIDAAIANGLADPLKLNCVVVRDMNDADVVDLARLTLDRDWYIRFIELMPFGDDECSRVSLARYVPNHETKERIEQELGRLVEVDFGDPSDESRNYRLPDAPGVVGFISPVSEPYCRTCNRMRLTADGKLHLCLLKDDEIDLRSALRNGAELDEIAGLILRGVEEKPVGHSLSSGHTTEQRSMFQIGG